MINMTNDSIPLSALLRAHDRAASAWLAVHMARVMAADAGLDVSASFTDREGRAIVDALPTVDVYEIEPVTVRCYGVAA